MLNLFRKKEQHILLVKTGSISGADIEKLEKLGHTVIQTSGDEQSVTKLTDPISKNEGDGKAVFLDAGTEAEFKELKKEDDGTAPWYKRLANL